MSKNETPLKAKLVAAIKSEMSGVVCIGHQDVRRSGIPDLSVSFNRTTSWWEVKHATPNFLSPGIQELTCCQLQEQGFCWYIIFVDDINGGYIGVYKPSDIKGCKGKLSLVKGAPVATFTRKNYKGVAEWMKEVIHF